jgi:hypothetical protein
VFSRFFFFFNIVLHSLIQKIIEDCKPLARIPDFLKVPVFA